MTDGIIPEAFFWFSCSSSTCSWSRQLPHFLVSVCHRSEQALFCRPCCDPALPWCHVPVPLRSLGARTVPPAAAGTGLPAQAGKPRDRHVCCAQDTVACSCPPLPLWCSSGLMLMFPGQLWPGTVEGQSLNEPLRDLPQLLTISLPLVRQGSTAHAVSLHHFFPMPFPPACSTQTNQLSMKTQTGAFFLGSSSSLALTHISQVYINLHFFLSLLPLSCRC